MPKQTKEKPEEKAPEHYTVGRWRDKENYECAYCPFSTLHKNTIYKHYLAQHAPPPPPPTVKIPVYNRFGNEVDEPNPLNVEGE